MILKLCFFFLAAFLVPYFMGLLLCRILRLQQDSLCLSVVCGYLMIWSLFQCLAVPCIYQKVPFSTFYCLILGITAGIAVISVLVNLSRLPERVKAIWGNLTSQHPLMLLVLLLILAQVAYLFFAVLGDDDDAFYVVTASTALQTNTLMEFDPYTGLAYAALPSRYVLSPFPLYVAVMAKITQVEAVTMAHTFLPVSLVLLAYMVYSLLGDTLFSKKRPIQKSLFLLFVIALLCFDGYSVYTTGVFLLTRIWQGKAVLAAILLPVITYLGLLLIREKLEGAKGFFLLLLASCSCCFVSSMGIMLGAIAIGLAGLVAMLVNRRGKTLLLCLLGCLPNLIFAAIYVLIR